MVHMTENTECQLKRKGSFGRTCTSTPSTAWRSASWPKRDKKPIQERRRKPRISHHPQRQVRPLPELSIVLALYAQAGITLGPSALIRKLCLLLMAGIVRVKVKVKVKTLKTAPTLVEDNDHEQHAVEDEALVTMRDLNAQDKEDDHEERRQNILHTCCRLENKVCMMVTDGGICTNCACTYLVGKLNLPTIKHPGPYQLQWLNDCGELRVNRQVLVSFTIGRYTDEVLCDAIPMQASHILLGRPWESDRKAMHDGFSNKYHFVVHNKPVTLEPLTAQQVYMT